MCRQFVLTARSEPADREILTVVGIGDDGPAGLGETARSRIERADLLIGGRRHLAMFPAHSGERWTVTRDVGTLADSLDAEIGHRRAVVLASGDPCHYGIGPLLATRLGRERIEIIPHPSAASLAFARLGLAWQDARVVSAHGRPLEEAVRKARGAAKLCLLTDDENTPAMVAKSLLEAGLYDTEAWVFEHLGGVSERQIDGLLSWLAEQTFAALNVLVIPNARWDDRGQVFGRSVDAFEHTAGLITKPEVRAISLSKLRIMPSSVVWDVGAGSGSLAIEAAGLASQGRVFAVERSAEQIALLERNVRAHGRQGLVEVVGGSAPGTLEGLPNPDAVFVGGGGNDLLHILAASLARLAAGGRIVVNLVALERVSECLAWARRQGLTPKLVQVAVSRGVEIAGATRLQADNPVSIITIERPA